MARLSSEPKSIPKSDPKIESGQVLAYGVPTDQPEESDGTATWKSTTMVLVRLRSAAIDGLGYTYSDEAAAYVAQSLIQKCVVGADPFAISQIHDAMDRFTRNMGRPGLVSTAISAVDVCLWDLKSRLLGLPLVQLLGQAHTSISAYGSGGFTSYSEKQLVHQLGTWADDGLPAVKMKIGREPDNDLKRVSAVKKKIGDKTELFVDANGAYSRKQALAEAQKFAEMGVTWFEEPVSSDDRTGLKLLVENAPPPLRIAAGEYIYVLDDARALIDSEAVDVLQADATRCGGISNFLKIAAACEMYHLPFSTHTAPSIHASVACAAIPAINIEYFHDHVRIEHLFFDGAAMAVQGRLTPNPGRPGLGLELKSDAQAYQTLALECPA